jgi:tetratricopeptide (TPR) repeat protein
LKIHPNDVSLEEFFLSLSSERRRLADHLVRCGSCRKRLRRLIRRRPGPVADRVAETLQWPSSPAQYGLALNPYVLSQSFALAKERLEAPGLFLELLDYPAERREFLLHNSSRFHTWGVFELLVERSLETAIRDPDHAEELGLLALRLSGYLDTAYYGAELIEDLRARAWAHVGNACRVRSDLHAAEESFRTAYEHLQKGTRDSLERAIFLDLKASLRRDQRQFEEAFKLLHRAIQLFLQTGQQHRAGRSLVNMDDVYRHVGQPELGIPFLYRALELIDAEQEPRLLLCARHNLIADLAESDRFLEAQGLYRATRPLYRDFAEPWVQNRRKWVRGMIARGLGQPNLAEVLFRAARDGFLVEGIPYDTALVSLDLASLYAEQGHTAELKRLAEEMVPIFASRQIHREALAALAFFRQAVEAENVSLELLAGIAAYLRRAQHDPEQRFQPPVTT